MEFKHLIESLGNNLHTLMELWPLKLVSTIFLTVVSSNHAIALYVFSTMVFIDLLSKIIALSHQRRLDKGEPSDFYHSITGIAQAAKDQYIQSSIMKHQFSSKIILYMFLTLSAVCVDYFLMKAGYKQLSVFTIWGYLALTEFCSILENLQDAQAEYIYDLLKLINKNKFPFLKDSKNKSFKE